jgi:hypothetical protein
MGYFIIGKEYPIVKCHICSNNYKVNEANRNGVDKEDAEWLTKSGLKCKEADHVCTGCILDVIIEQENKQREKENENKQKFKRDQREVRRR